MKNLHKLLAVFAILLLGACASPKQPPLPIGNMTIGIAPVTQPMGVADMLAGYMPEETPRVEEKVLSAVDAIYAEVLFKETKHTYVGQEMALQCYRKQTKSGEHPRQSALRTWSAVGRCMNVDLLIVPQILHWEERDGGSAGVSKPATVVMDTFIIDVKQESLISRSHYNETQTPLSSNLLEAGKFFKRGARWVTAEELAKEGVQKAVKELGL